MGKSRSFGGVFRLSSVVGLAASLVLILAACSSPSTNADDTAGVDQAAGIEQAAGETGESFDYSSVNYDAEPGGSALRGNRSDPAFPPPLVDPEMILSGGPAPDGIPPIDRPTFLAIDEVEFLSDEEAVIAVEIEGDVRAYPVQVLIWHEIVNDEIGGVPIAVTYCPLCNSALAFDRRFGQRVLDFGTSGELYQSALVMYDRQTESLWAHFTGRGLVGHYAGAELELFSAQTVSWAEFAELYPNGRVLSRDTGFDRPYGQNPYVGYDNEDEEPIGSFFRGEVDPTLPAKARVVGINDAEGSVAVRLADLEANPALAISDGGRNLVIFHRPGLASALDSSEVGGGRDIGQTGVFEASGPDGQPLTFAGGEDDGFVDRETGSTWNLAGVAIAGPLAGARLTSVPHLDTFWFAWATYRPDTTLVPGP